VETPSSPLPIPYSPLQRMQKNHEMNFIGRVVDQRKYAPISGVKVLLNIPGAPPVVYTDLEGIYRFTVKSDSDSINGQITIEAKGYRSYNSSIKLLPDKRDLGDIRLLRTDEEVNKSAPTSTSREISKATSTESSMLILVLLAVMTGLIIMVAAVTKPSHPPDRRQEMPEKTRKDRSKHRSHRNYYSMGHRA
jgi:hypothetical protein